MHTATQLDPAQFTIEIDGETAQPAQLFPDWRPHDRFGIVIHEPVGMVGASMLTQVAITLYYGAREERRTTLYPEIYAFHVGEWWGDHSYFDFWPDRKEVLVEDDPVEILAALNDRAITRLAVPEGAGGPIEHRWKEDASAVERITSAFIYSSSGRVADPDVTVTGTSPQAETNASWTLDPDAALDQLGRAPVATDPREVHDTEYWMARSRRRIGEVPTTTRELVAQRRRAIQQDGFTTEAYRLITPERALGLLATPSAR